MSKHKENRNKRLIGVQSRESAAKNLQRRNRLSLYLPMQISTAASKENEPNPEDPRVFADESRHCHAHGNKIGYEQQVTILSRKPHFRH